jgi:hypothetical protein
MATGELALHFTRALPVIEQILFIAAAYAAGSALLLIVKPIRNELTEILRLLPSSRGSLSERLAGALD